MKNILVIEDDLMFCKLLSNYLDKNGYSAAQAPDGASAKRQLQEMTFDVVLADYRLPDTNGIDLVKWISEHDMETKVVLMSRMLDDHLRDEAKELGVFGFLSKPFKPVELLELLKGIGV